MEEFYQKEELSTRIGNILEEYPAGIGPFKEFIQNADDARARRVCIVYDETDHRKIGKGEEGNGLLSKEMEEWQGPSLLVYNDSVFSDDDFANIVSLGKSQKHDDNSRIGKYGLGFNVAYHFTDVVSFISRNQIVLFDPHGQSLPDGKQGLRIKFLDGDFKEKYHRQFEPFSSVKELNCNLNVEFQGTLIRLPLRTPSQAEKSSLCKSHYQSKEIKGILHDLANSAASILLFLKYVEEISIFFKDGDKEMKVSTGKVLTSDSLRRERSLINEYVSGMKSGAKKGAKSSFDMEISTSIDSHLLSFETILIKENLPSIKPDSHLEEREKWHFYQGTGEESKESASLAARSKSIHWGSIASRLSFTSNFPNSAKMNRRGGNAYSFLPLPIETGLPVHLNAFFAVSSNRRTLWMGTSDSTGSGELKVAWNEFTLRVTLPIIYADFILSCREQYQNGENCYEYWPDLSKVKTPFDQLSIGAASEIFKRKLPVFYCKTTQKWLDLTQIVVEDSQTRTHCREKLRNALSKAGVFLLDLPKHVKSLLKAAHISYKVADAKFITDSIRNSRVRLEYEEAEELLEYVLYKEKLELNQEFFSLLNGIRCVPLIREQLGMFKMISKDKSKPLHSDDFFYICSNAYLPLLPQFSRIVNSDSKSFEKLKICAVTGVANIQDIHLEVFMENMKDALPSSWQGASCVFFPQSSKKDYYGIKRDESTALFNQQDANSNSNATSVSSTAKEEDDDSWGEAPTSRKKKNSRTKVSKPVEILQPVQKSEEPTEDEIKERIELFWKFIDEKGLPTSSFKSVLGWPLVITEEGYCVSVDYAKQRIVIPSFCFKSELKAIFRKFGVLFASHATLKEGSLSLLLETRQNDVVKALSNSSPESVRTVSQEDLKHIRNEVVSLAENESLDANSIRSLPIFETFAKTLVSVSSSGSAIATPPDEEDEPWKPFTEWDQILSEVVPEMILDLREPISRKVFKLTGLSRLPEDRFLLNFFIPKFKEMDVEASVQCFKVLSKKRLSKKKQLECFDSLKRTHPIINSNGERFPCNHFIDPEDRLLCQILGDNAENHFPPVEYRDSSVLQVMRQIGIRQVTNPTGFCMAAEKMKSLKDPKLGTKLCQVFADVHRDQNWEGWGKNVYSSLAELAFIPALDYRRCKSNPSWFPLPSIDPFNDEINRNKKKNKPLGHQGYKSMKMQIEAEMNDDYELEGEESQVDWEPVELFERAASMVDPPPPSTTQSLVTFSAPHHCVQKAVAFCCWTSSLILPTPFDTVPPKFLKLLLIESKPSAATILNHLVTFTELWGSNESYSMKGSLGLSKSEIVYIQGVTTASLTPILKQLEERGRYMNRVNGSDALPETKALSFQREGKVINQLRSHPFILTDSGVFVYSKQIVFDIDQDLSADMRAPPHFLEPFADIIESVNSSGHSQMQSQRPSIQVENPAEHRVLLDLLLSSLDDPTFADVVFNLVDGRKIHAHKLVLSFSSEIFNSMFRSGMKESGIGLVNIQMQEWCTYESLWVYLHFIYSGNFNSKFKVEPPTQNSVQTVCSLLRLADEYLNTYIKQWCERYLTEPSLVQLRNICSLLCLAEETNSAQLTKFYLNEARNSVKVLSLTEEWETLPEHLKKEITKIK